MRIAIYHTQPSGGPNARFRKIVRRLGERHTLALYHLSCSNQSFGDVRPFVAKSHAYQFNPLPEFHRPSGRLNFGARLLDLFPLRRLHRRIPADIDEQRYDFVHIYPCQLTQTPLLLHFRKTPSVYYGHEPLRDRNCKPTIDRPYRIPRLGVRWIIDHVDCVSYTYRHLLPTMDARSAREATLVVTNGYFTREALYRIYGVSAHVCYHGIHTKAFRPLRSVRDCRVLSVGALTPARGFDFIIDSLPLIPAAYRPSLTVVSDYQMAAELEYLEDLARRRAVSVEFRALVDDEELIRLYNTVLMTVYAPIMAPFGLVPLESMACGIPVVGVREGGVRETILDDETGYLVDRDPRDFAEAVLRLIREEMLTEKYGRNGRSYVVENWNWEKALHELEGHLLCVAIR